MNFKVPILSILFLCKLAFARDPAPRFLAEPQSAIVRTGASLVLYCTVETDTATVRWMVNGSYLTSQKRRGFERDGSNLRIVSFNQPDSLSHEGAYQCVASNSVGTVVSREAKLEAAVLNPYSTPRTLTEVTGVAGNVAVIPCSLPESRPRAVVEFQFNGSRLLPSGRHVFLPSGHLQISRVGPTDQGVYQCSAVNTVTRNTVANPTSFRLRVIVPKGEVSPVFTSTPSDSVTVNQGSNLTLECAAEGWPVPHVTWEKYGGHLPVGRFSQVLGNLVITRIQRFDAGTYLCRVNKSTGGAGGGGGPPLDKVINVDVLEPPSIETFPVDQTATEGSTVEFKCRPQGSPKQGFPKPSIQWLFNGEIIVNEQFVAVRDTTLTLSNIHRRRAGIYQCVVRNGLGMVHAAARLVVADPHAHTKAPPIVSPTPMRNVGDGDDGEEEEQDYYDEPENEDWDSQGGMGESEDRPQPSKPEVTILSNTSVVLQWRMQLTASGDPAVEMFKIKVKEIIDESSSKWALLDDDVSYGLRMFEVRNLKAGKTYRFRIVVIYSDDVQRVGPVSNKVTLVSSSGSGKGQMPAPVIVEAKPVSKNRIYIAWQQPSTDQWPVETFFLYYNPYNRNENSRKLKLPGTGPRNFMLSDLSPATAYSIRLRSFGKSGDKSALSTAVVTNTLKGDGSDDKLDANNFPGGSFVSPRKLDRVTPAGQAEDQEVAHDIGDRSADNQLPFIIMGIVLGVVVIIAISGAFVCFWKRNRKQQYADGERKHADQTTAFLSPKPDGVNGLVNIGDYTYKVDHGHVPGCSGECCLSGGHSGNGFSTARDTRPPGCTSKALGQQRKMAPDLVLPPPPPVPPPCHSYRGQNPDGSIYDTVDDDHGKVSPAYAKVSSVDTDSIGGYSNYPNPETSFGNLTRPTSDSIPPKPLDGHAYWVLEHAKNQSLPERTKCRVADTSCAPPQGLPFRQSMSVSQPCNRPAKAASDREGTTDDEPDFYEKLSSASTDANLAVPSASGHVESDRSNPGEPLPWSSGGGFSAPKPLNTDRFYTQEPIPGGRKPSVSTDPNARDTNQDSWKNLTSQVSSGQYSIQSGAGKICPHQAPFSHPRANDYPSSDQEECR